MTIPLRKSAPLIRMHLHPFLLATACLILPALTARADEPPLRELLRDGLYAEEVTRDPEAAAKQYEQVLTRYAEQRDFAAAALFRLAEVRRKQDRKEDAVKLYQLLLAEFPGAENETKLARENLAALGGKPAESAPAQGDAESYELARLQAAAKSSPDVLLDPQNMQLALSKDMPKVVEFLLAAGSRPYDGVALPLAVERGNLDITRLFLEKGGEVPPELARKAIGSAIDFKRPTILEFLLEKGLRPVSLGESGIPPLVQALVQDNFQAAEILLKHGADLNEIVAPGPGEEFRSGGTPLHLCIWRPKLDAAAWLLEKGAKPDIATPGYGITPLHLAVTLENPGTLALMAKLLVAGADPNHRSGPDSSNHSQWILNATPLESAIGFSSTALEKAKLLLKHGVDPKRKDSRVAAVLAYAIENRHPNVMELVQLLGEAGFPMDSPELLEAAMGKNQKIVPLLLKHGANPNAIGSKDPLLQEAARNADAELVKMLIEAGADLNFQNLGNTILWDTATASNSSSPDRIVECLKLLVAAGAKPPETSWVTNGYRQMSPLVRRYLTEQFIIPTLVGGPDITLTGDAAGGIPPLKLASWQEGMEVPDLTTLLWASQSKVRILKPASEAASDYNWSIRRKGADGKIEELKFDFFGSAPFPRLQWGDLVQVELVDPPYPFNSDYRDGFTSKMTWFLRQRISFPVTVEIEGKIREIKVRGDRVIFDPTLDEVPLCDAQKLVEWLWQPRFYLETSPPTILATRKRWPEVRLAYNSKEARKFQLQAGDRVKVEIPAEARDAQDKFRRLTIAVQVPGLPFRRDFGGWDNGVLLPVSVPTLIQAIVETQVPGPGNWDVWRKWADGVTPDSPNLLYAPSVFNNFTLLPHPDLAHIRIRRLQEDGNEKVIDVDLAKAISEASADISPDAALKADVILLGGDVVEIPLKKAALASPWKGFAPEEERFFAKALSGKVQLTDDQGNVSFSEIDYRTPRFIETEVGLLPVPAASGVPSARGWWIANSDNGSFLRPGVERGEIGTRPVSAFLRNGDEYRGGGPRPRPPRVVPSPAPSSR